MTPFPFSALGVEKMLTQLYALPDNYLSAQAEAIKLDFKRWMKERFILTENQLHFLKGISNEVSLSYGEQCSFCFLHRLDIKLVSPVSPEGPGISKWITSESTIAVKTNGTGESVVSGGLTFTISYR